MAETTKIQRITGVERVKGYTRNGNPKLAVTFADMTIANIAPDVGISYKVGNPEYRNRLVSVTYDGRSRITNVEIPCDKCNK